MNVTLFPQLKGIDWNVKMSPEFFGLEAKGTAPGYDTEISFGPDPIYHFECDYTVLRETFYISGGVTNQYDELHTLMNFFEYMRGKFTSFLLSLPRLTQNSADGSKTGQVLTVDGSGYAPIVVSRTYQNENIYELAGINGNPGTPPVVKLNGVTKTLGVDYNILGPGVALAGVTYPGLVLQWLIGHAGTTTIDMTWYYRVRFQQSIQEFSVFSFLLWECKQVQMVGTRT